MKSIKLKCTIAEVVTGFVANSLYKGREHEDGTREVKHPSGKFYPMGKHDEFQMHNVDEVHFAKFVELKTKTLKCVGHLHGNGVKKSFKKDKRYQIDQMRPVGTIAGYIFDGDGCRWGLFREDVGFSTLDGSLFEAKYS